MREQQQMMMREQEMRAQQAAAAAAAAALPPHNPDWSEQEHEGAIYYWNSRTGESTYTRPTDFNPSAPPPHSTKGPPGANLFIQRKMRRGEYDQFSDEDLRREFGQFGNVTRAEMTIDRENGWSKGFGFVSFSTVEEADAAMKALNGQVLAGKEMKVERTHDN